MADILTKIKSTADILGGSVFFANDEGFDPDYLENGDLLPNGMYIRLEGSDGSVAYISAYELDNSLNIIDQMTRGKANQADVDALIELINSKATNSSIELLESELLNKADKSTVDSLSASILNKADKSTVDELSVSLIAKANQSDFNELSEMVLSKADQSAVNSLTDTLSNKANKSTVDSLRQDITNLQSVLDTLTDTASITAIQNQISYLNDELNKKLDSSEVSSVVDQINELVDRANSTDSKLENIETNLNKKATTAYVQGHVTEINSVLTKMATTVDGKADKTSVATKANQEEVDKLSKKVADLNTTVSSSLTSLDINYQDIANSLSGKADKAYTDSAIANLSRSINDKAVKSEVAKSINDLNTRLYNVEENCEENYSTMHDSFHDLETNVNNAIAEVNATLYNQTKELTKLKSSDTEQSAKIKDQEEKLKNEWVRVMTPEAYKKLPPVGDTYNDGTPNPYAKQANTIYMLVRYNKPIAVYIGEVLIAQAEQKGSVGFAYSFPIIFQ